MRQMSKPYTPSDTFVLVLIPTILGALCLSILRDITIPACVPRSKLGYERSRRIGYGRVSGSQWAPSGPTGSPVRLFDASSGSFRPSAELLGELNHSGGGGGGGDESIISGSRRCIETVTLHM